ncbi:transposase [Novosphingobium sp. AAP83]|uniref:transposase n=1 Tax=Novosphingobium sp. AAP83 TaxID=1523425 RepID=UPI000AE23743|nr:transposase [Novosphingobium sp. AAP83]
MQKDTMIGVDLAKAVFQVHGASMTGEPRFRKKLSRQSFPKFMAEQPPALVVMEACAGGDRPGQQDGPYNLGNADEEGGLSSFGTGRSCIDIMPQILPEAG